MTIQICTRGGYFPLVSKICNILNQTLISLSNEPVPKIENLDYFTHAQFQPNYIYIFRWVEFVTGKPIVYDTEASRLDYIESLDGLPQYYYDPEGFLNSIGVYDVKTAGRTPENFTRLLPYFVKKHERKWYWPVQRVAIGFWDLFPDSFLSFAKDISSFLLKDGDNPVPKPISPSTTVSTEEDVGEKQPMFGRDYHMGIPKDGAPPKYGTYYIALSAGLNDESARRIAIADYSIDTNESPYGNSSSIPYHAPSRHFNTNYEIFGAEDTRLTWASYHLRNAIKLAKGGNTEEAERELGYGLHSLQDLFAHAQISPFIHVTLGTMPDVIAFNPMAVFEASRATLSYLSAYRHAIETSH